LDVIAAGYPTVQLGSCGGPPATTLSTVTAGGSSLSYDPLTDIYTYVWKTDKAWAGQCGLLTVQLTDGTVATANFKFK
jgi:hypothetical protein